MCSSGSLPSRNDLISSCVTIIYFFLIGIFALILDEIYLVPNKYILIKCLSQLCYDGVGVKVGVGVIVGVGVNVGVILGVGVFVGVGNEGSTQQGYSEV